MTDYTKEIHDIESAMSAAMALQVLDGKPGFKIQPEDRDRLVMAREVNRLRELIQCEAILLDAWARESREGGWSTHQVDPMRNRADELRRLVHGAEHPKSAARAARPLA